MLRKQLEMVLVKFDCKDIPKELYFGFIQCNVRECEAKLGRGFDSQELAEREGKERCVKCGVDDSADTKPKCCDWGGEYCIVFGAVRT